MQQELLLPFPREIVDYSFCDGPENRQPSGLIYNLNGQNAWIEAEKIDGFSAWRIRWRPLERLYFKDLLSESAHFDATRVALTPVDDEDLTWPHQQSDKIRHPDNVDASRELYAAYIVAGYAPPVAVVEHMVKHYPDFAASISPYLLSMIKGIGPPREMLQSSGRDEPGESMGARNRLFESRLHALRQTIENACVDVSRMR